MNPSAGLLWLHAPWASPDSMNWRYWAYTSKWLMGDKMRWTRSSVNKGFLQTYRECSESRWAKLQYPYAWWKGACANFVLQSWALSQKSDFPTGSFCFRINRTLGCMFVGAPLFKNANIRNKVARSCVFLMSCSNDKHTRGRPQARKQSVF